MCPCIGIHHLSCEIHSHQALPGDRAGLSLRNMLCKELASEKDFHWLDILFALLYRYHNTPLYHGLSPNENVFGRKKCSWNMPLNKPRPYKEASLFMHKIESAENTASISNANQVEYYQFLSYLRHCTNCIALGMHIALSPHQKVPKTGPFEGF